MYNIKLIRTIRGTYRIADGDVLTDIDVNAYDVYRVLSKTQRRELYLDSYYTMISREDANKLERLV